MKTKQLEICKFNGAKKISSAYIVSNTGLAIAKIILWHANATEFDWSGPETTKKLQSLHFPWIEKWKLFVVVVVVVC